MMLRLKINPHEFAAMIYFMRQATAGYRQRPLKSQSIKVLIMAQYLAKWNNQKLTLWLLRPFKRYTLSLPLPLARTLHQDMQVTYLGEWQQVFLNTLDQAITNYQDPLGEAHTIGELIGQQRLV